MLVTGYRVRACGRYAATMLKISIAVHIFKDITVAGAMVATLLSGMVFFVNLYFASGPFASRTHDNTDLLHSCHNSSKWYGAPAPSGPACCFYP